MWGARKVVAGVDVGSTQTKAVILSPEREIVGRALVDTGARLNEAARAAFEAALQEAGLSPEDVEYTVGTGYGRFKVEFGDTQVTEISCHARGACFLFPNTRTVLDIGGQDTKAIRVGPGGEVLDFCMNDKCSAGTGRFLGAASAALEIPLGELGPLALTARNPVTITTTCTVFAESEILGWLARGRKVEDILMGVHASIASRSLSLLRRVGIEPELTFTGGVARNVAMVHLIREMSGVPVNVSEESHFCGAIGAALFALDHVLLGERAGAAVAAGGQ
ncbi:MAG: acyl-CoA dehydratase activase [Armatimonadota bacterium]|nr:acyl-CoA dehydratase activase [Armatimonadota bacterium]MDR7430722.1 acyl-CoA dehydratase activase [Armatimonadota bacterium]MDR7477923.1 acyl-CoA dehydratase activase [Armatimonadota bacterium]MDR7542529.1 acyl-CoA dehydratase activase [Armatimonadota bacterium]MDR7590894.1 acyl-CoA dehydratase activase [Armatimonadota bacterium]